MTMSEFFKHMKKVAIADSKLFLEPYVAVYQVIKRNFTQTSVKR